MTVDVFASTPLVAIRGLTKSYPGVRALSGVDLTLMPGEVHSIVGENGAGKSTLIKILAGVERRDGGTISWDGRQVSIQSPQAATALGISVIHQDLNLAPNLSAAENIMLGQRLPRWCGTLVDWRAVRTRSRAATEFIGGDFDVRTPVSELDHAQQVLVAVARALATDARLIVMDEPTAALSASEVARLHEVIRVLISQGTAILYVSHRLQEVLELSAVTTIFKDGTHVGTYARAEIRNVDQLTELIIGRPKQTMRRYAARGASGEVLAELRSVALGHRLKNVSLSLRSGEILGLAGLVGSGRSEVASILFGTNRPSRGQVRVHDRQVARLSPMKARKLGVALLPEDRRRQATIANMSVLENATLASLDRYRRGVFIAHRRERQHVCAMVDRFRIKVANVDEPIRRLSGGNQQKVVVARWVDRDPSVVIFDEPTQGIDVGAKTEVFQIMRDLADRGRAVMFISSELEEIVEVADRIVVLREGSVVAQIDGGAATTDSILRACFGEQNDSQ